MGYLRHALLAAIASLFCFPYAATQSFPIYQTHITLTSLLDGTSPVASATVCLTPANQYGSPISVSASGFGFITQGARFCGTVTAGALVGTLSVPNACLANSAAPIYYNLTIQELDGSGNPTGVPVSIASIPNVCGASYDLTSYTPVASTGASLSPPLAQGVGVPATCTTPSIWINSLAPALYLCQGGSYVSVSTVGSPGATGPVTPVQLSNAIGAAVLGGPVVSSANVFDYTAVTSGVALMGTNGTTTALSGYTTTDYMYVGGATQFISNGRVGFYSVSGYGIAFYTSSMAFLSGDLSQSTNDAAGGVVHAIPAGAQWMRLYFADSIQPVPYSQLMVVLSTTLPGSYVAYGPVPTGPTNPLVSTSALNAALAALPPSTGGVTLTQVNNAIATTLAGAATTSLNIFDSTAATSGEVVKSSNGTVSALSGYTASDYMVVTGATQYIANARVGYYTPGGDGVAFYTGTKSAPVFLSGDTSQTDDDAAPGTVHTIPAGATLMRLYFNDIHQTIPYSQVMVVLGTTLPGSYVPFATSSNPYVQASTLTSTLAAGLAGGTAVDATARTAAQPLQGVNVGWLGDSISYGQGSGLPLSPLIAAIDGNSNTYSLSWSGRRMYDALDNVGNTGVAFPTQTVVQGLKVLVLWLGTNLDGAAGGNVGSISDTASVGTSNANGITFPSTDSYVAQTKGVLNQLLVWNPTLRIVLVTPYQSAIRNAANGCTGYGAGVIPCPAGLADLFAVVMADRALANAYSLPVIDMYDGVGINNLTSPTMTVDGVHPTAATQQNVIAPYLARQIAFPVGTPYTPPSASVSGTFTTPVTAPHFLGDGSELTGLTPAQVGALSLAGGQLNAFAPITSWSGTHCFINLQIDPMCGMFADGGDPLLGIHNASSFGLFSNQYYQVPPGGYNVSHFLSMIGSNTFSNVTFDFTGSTMTCTSTSVQPFDADGPGGVTLTNIKIKGGYWINCASLFGTYATTQSQINGLTFDDVHVVNAAGPGIGITNSQNQATSSWQAVKNVKILNSSFDGTGGPSISIQGVLGLEIAHVTSTNPNTVGITGNYEPDNFAISGEGIYIHDNEFSGTVPWNLTPFGSNSPAAAVYLSGSQDFRIIGNYFHDSYCTLAFCGNHGASTTSQLIGTAPFGGDYHNYASPGDCIHVDTALRGVVTNNDCSGYYNGIIVEVAKNVTVTANSIHEIVSNMVVDNSRDQTTSFNTFASTGGITTGSSAITLATTTSGPGCSGTCTVVSIPANTSGTILSQTNSSAGFPLSALYPAIGTLMSSVAQLGGAYSLVLSQTSTCIDGNGITLPFPAMTAGETQQQYFFTVPHALQLFFLHFLNSSSTQTAGIQTWCITSTGTGSAASTLTLANLGTRLWSSGNVYSANSMAHAGVNAFAVGGCGDGPLITGNIGTDIGSWGDWAYSYYGYALSVNVGQGAGSTCTRSNLAYKHNSMSITRQLSAVGAGYYTPVSIGNQSAFPGDPPIVNIALEGNDFPGYSGAVYSSTLTTTPFIGLNLGHTWPCQPNFDGGSTALAAGTYHSRCYNTTGQTITITSIGCRADAGSSTLAVANGAGTALLASALTCADPLVSGTQSPTTNLAPGDYLVITFTADGTTTQASVDVVGMYP